MINFFPFEKLGASNFFALGAVALCALPQWAERSERGALTLAIEMAKY